MQRTRECAICWSRAPRKRRDNRLCLLTQVDNGIDRELTRAPLTATPASAGSSPTILVRSAITTRICKKQPATMLTRPDAGPSTSRHTASSEAQTNQMLQYLIGPTGALKRLETISVACSDLERSGPQDVQVLDEAVELGAVVGLEVGDAACAAQCSLIDFRPMTSA